MVKLIIVTLITVVAFIAGSFEPAFADEVYSFQFEKSTAPKANEPGPPRATQAPAQRASFQELSPTEKGWGVGFGFAGAVETETYKETQAIALFADYRWNKYLGGEGQLIYGRGDDRSSHVSGAFGAKVTPIHIQLLDWDLLDAAGSIGLMNSSRQDDPDHAKIAVFVGFGVIFNIAQRFAIQYSDKREAGNSEMHQSLFSGLYRF